ncbi:MAG: 4-alpha-glucanotransferase [Myxococcota bacterium]
MGLHMTTRRAGLLLHPSSLSGPYGIGDIGPSARNLMGWLESAGIRLWQFLPLNPVDGLGCPYASPSAFAAEPLLISIDDLITDGWLKATERPLFPGSIDRVDWSWVHQFKGAALRVAAARVAQAVDVRAWAVERDWVLPWATFSAHRDVHGGEWQAWPAKLGAVDDAVVDVHIALQWLFDQQWSRLREVARSHGIALWGDLPMFVGASSADTWSHPELFQLGQDQRPSVVTGAPPDAFSPTGQKWGHAHFDVERHRDTDHAWWVSRMSRLLEHVDAVRLDHFRGLAAVWEIPAHDPDATGGRWVPGLGAPLLAALQTAFGSVPVIAEDLGVITPDVSELRDAFGLPGMAIAQFAYTDNSDASQPYLPHNHRASLVVYPGTHDNDTVVGWYASADERTRDHVRRYLAVSGNDIAGDILRSVYRSVADTCIVALQDVLALGGGARMNRPGTSYGNWQWRCRADALNVGVARRLREEANLSGRI